MKPSNSPSERPAGLPISGGTLGIVGIIAAVAIAWLLFVGSRNRDLIDDYTLSVNATPEAITLPTPAENLNVVKRTFRWEMNGSMTYQEGEGEPKSLSIGRKQEDVIQVDLQAGRFDAPEKATLNVISGFGERRHSLQGDTRADHPLAGRKFHLTYQDGTPEVLDDGGTLLAEPKRELAAELMTMVSTPEGALSRSLVGRSYSVGETFSLPGIDGSELLGSSEDIVMNIDDIRFRYMGTGTVGSARCALFVARMSVESTYFGAMHIRMDLVGEVAMDAGSGTLTRLFLTGPIEIAGGNDRITILTSSGKARIEEARAYRAK
jgi:hypothetical protein